jgi:hypothetical protein
MEVEIRNYKRYPKPSEIEKWNGNEMIKKTLIVPKIARRSRDNENLITVLLMSEMPNIFSNPRLYKNIPLCGKFGLNLISMSFFLDANCVFEEGFRWVVDEMKIDLSKIFSDRCISISDIKSADPEVKNWIKKNINDENFTSIVGFDIRNFILNKYGNFPNPQNF